MRVQTAGRQLPRDQYSLDVNISLDAEKLQTIAAEVAGFIHRLTLPSHVSGNVQVVQ